MIKRLFTFVKQLLQEFGKDKVGQLSAAFAYITIFSIGPLLLVLLSVAGLVLGQRAANGQLAAQLSSTVGSDAAHTLQTVIAHSRAAASSVPALIIGIAGMLLGAASITSQLQSSFDAILGAVPDPKAGIKGTIYVKIKNVVCVLLASLLVGASLVGSAIVIGLGNKLQHHVPIPPASLEILNETVSLAVCTGLLYFIYRTLPDLVIPRRIVLRAALLVGVLFVAGKVVLSIVIGRNATASAYGAAAALITLLLWTYYTAELLFLGTEYMKVYGLNHGLAFAPKRFSLSRMVVHIDAQKHSGRLVEAWLRGFRKHQR